MYFEIWQKAKAGPTIFGSQKDFAYSSQSKAEEKKNEKRKKKKKA